MKITDITIGKEELADGSTGIACRVTLSDGSQIASAGPWRNPIGIWASDSDEREPAEIAAWLRSFAQSIEGAAKAMAA